MNEAYGGRNASAMGRSQFGALSDRGGDPRVRMLVCLFALEKSAMFALILLLYGLSTFVVLPTWAAIISAGAAVYFFGLGRNAPWTPVAAILLWGFAAATPIVLYGVWHAAA